MVRGRLAADVEPAGDLGVRQARPQQAQHLLLPAGEHAEPLRPGAGADAERTQQRRHPVGVERGAQLLEHRQGPAGMVDGDLGLAVGEQPGELGAVRASSNGSSSRAHPWRAASSSSAAPWSPRGHRHPARAAAASASDRSLPVAVASRASRPPSLRAPSTSPAASWASTSRSSGAPAASDAAAIRRSRGSRLRIAAGASPRASSSAATDSASSASASTPSPTCAEQLVGLLEPALTDAQRGEPGQRLGVQAGTGAVGDPQPGGQLPLGVGPAALGGEHAAVVDAALGVQERAAVGRDEVVGHLAPLRRPLEVVGQLTGVEHVAAGVDDGVQRRSLPAQGRRHRLVEQSEPAAASPLPTRMMPELGQRERAPGRRHRPPGPRRGPARSAPRRRPDRSSGRRGPPTANRAAPRAERFQQPVRPPEPAVGGGEVGEVRLVGDRQPDRAPGRARRHRRPVGTGAYARVHRSTHAWFSPSHHRATASPKHPSAVSVSANAASNKALASAHRPASSAEYSRASASPTTCPLCRGQCPHGGGPTLRRQSRRYSPGRRLWHIDPGSRRPTMSGICPPRLSLCEKR